MEGSRVCSELIEMYTDPAAIELDTSCKVLCRLNYQHIQVKMTDCRRFCPNTYRCLLAYIQSSEHDVSNQIATVDSPSNSSILPVALVTAVVLIGVVISMIVIVSRFGHKLTTCLSHYLHKYEEQLFPKIPELYQQPEEDVDEEKGDGACETPLLPTEEVDLPQQSSQAQTRVVNETDTSNNNKNNTEGSTETRTLTESISGVTEDINNASDSLFHQSLPQDLTPEETENLQISNRTPSNIRANTEAVNLSQSDSEYGRHGAGDESMWSVHLDQDEDLLTRQKTVRYTDLPQNNQLPMEVSFG